MRHGHGLSLQSVATQNVAAAGFTLDVTGAQLRDALADPSAWGETLGPELSPALSALTVEGTATWAAGGGGWTLTSTASQSRPGVQWPANLTKAGSYRVTITVVSITGATQVRVDGVGSVDQLLSVGTTSFTATHSVSARPRIRLEDTSAISGDAFVISDFSVREVVTGWLLPGLGGARLSGDCRTSVAMQTEADGSIGFAAHNLLLQSDGYSDALITPATGLVVTATGLPNAWGRNVARQIRNTTTNEMHRLYTNVVATGRYTYSVEVKNVDAGFIQLSVAGVVVSAFGATFNLADQSATLISTGAMPTTAAEILPNGFVRYSLIAPANETASFNVQLHVLESAAGSLNPAFAGTAKSIIVGGAQLNLGPTALPYVPTTTAARFGPAIDWLSGIGAYGIRSESARTNLVLWSADMSNAAWATFGSGATKVGAAPALGAVPMYRVNVGTVGGSLSGASGVYSVTATMANATAYAASVVVRSVSGTSAFRLVLYNGAAAVGTSDLTATTTPQLITFTFTSAAAVDGQIGVRAATAGGVVGDIEVGGFQLEAGTEASSRILTLAAAATRAADTLVVLDSGWINQGEGTLAADFYKTTINSSAYYGGVFAADDGTSSNRIGAFIGASTIADAFAEQRSGSTSPVAQFAMTGASGANKVAIAYAANNTVASQNGSAQTTDTSCALPAASMTVMRVGAFDANLNGHITRIRYSRRRASNGQLQALTV